MSTIFFFLELNSSPYRSVYSILPPRARNELLPTYNFLFAFTRKNRELFFFALLFWFRSFYISSNHLPAKNTQFDFICQRRLRASRGGQEESSTARAQAARCDVDSPVRATQIRARERRAGRPAAAPREGEHALPWWLARPPLRPIVQRADCSTGTAWRATSRSSASRIHQCGHPSIACCTVACVPSTSSRERTGR